jgi:hypothetical protein
MKTLRRIVHALVTALFVIITTVIGVIAALIGDFARAHMPDTYTAEKPDAVRKSKSAPGARHRQPRTVNQDGSSV